MSGSYSAKTTNHSTSRGRRILRRASRKFCARSKPRCGEGGYHYIVVGDNFEPFDGEEQNGESAVMTASVE
jgi:hypothetical protein